MKKWMALFLVCLLCVTGPVGCGNAAKSEPVGTGQRDGQPLSMRVMAELDMAVETIVGYADGWVCVQGTHKQQQGYFFVNDKGEVLNDTVYMRADSFEYGAAYVKKSENDYWQQINAAGEMYEEFKEDYLIQRVEESVQTTINGPALTEAEMTALGYTAVGSAVYGLAPAVKEGKLVLIDTEGEVVLSSTLAVDSDTPLGYDGVRLAACREGKLVFADTTPTDEEVATIAETLLVNALQLNMLVLHGENVNTDQLLPVGTVVQTYNKKTAPVPNDRYGLVEVAPEYFGPIRTLNDLHDAIDAVYTEYTAYDHVEKHFMYLLYEDEELFPPFVEYNGKLYRAGGGRGQLYSYDYSTISVLANQGDSVVFTIVYEHRSYLYDEQQGVAIDPRYHLYTMKNTKNGWRLDTYYEDVEL